MLISHSYADKVWTTHEARSALARALTQKTEYILPVRFDATALPGLHHTISAVEFDKHGPEGIAQLLIQKLGRQVTGTPPIVTIVTSPPAIPQALDESRRLTPQQQNQITQELVTGGIGHVTIQYLHTGSAKIDNEPGDFALQVEETLRSAGWGVTLQTMSTFRGWIGTSITRPRGKPPLAEAQTLFHALSGAGVDVYYNETGLSIDDQLMLLIGKRGD